MDHYTPLSMIVEIDGSFCQPHGGVLRGPGKWRPELSRRIFHETVHYWQHISQGYLARVVEEDWERLKVYRDCGEVRSVGPLKRHFLTHDQEIGYSPLDLIECLARFWDVHVMGPHDLLKSELANPLREIKGITPEEYREMDSAGLLRRLEDDAYTDIAYELVMDVAAGHYALPYRQLRNASNSFRANTLFPIIGHLALHSTEPVQFFARLCNIALEKLDLKLTNSIETSWRYSYFDVFQLAQSLAKAMFDRPLVPATVVVEQGSLMEHPGYHAAWMNLTAHVQRVAEAAQESYLVGDSSLDRNLRAGLTVDYTLACNGVPNNRAADVLMLTAPPLVRFGNGGDWILQDLFQEETDVMINSGGIDLSIVRRKLAGALKRIDRDWGDLQRATVGY